MLALVFLCVQNAVIFSRHYFQGLTFPDDFLLTYHAIPYYWIEAAKLSKIIDWIPFQGMGYPSYMDLQNGKSYPPFWLFVLFGQTYTLHAAVIMQGLHVLLGAVGATACARLAGIGWKESFLAGVFYQCFGGFYSNAQHPDIVRAYAFLPWICGPALAQWNSRSRLLVACIALLPLWIFALWTGGYPGVAIATCIVAGGICTLRTATTDAAGRKTGLAILAAVIAGTLLAGSHLVPVFLSLGDIERSRQAGSISYDYLNLLDFWTTILPVDNARLGHDISMRSMFVGIPVLALALAGLPRLRDGTQWILMCAVLAALLAAGPLHQMVIALFPPAGMSRMTMADYRGFIGVALIVMAAKGVEAVSGAKPVLAIWAPALALLALLGSVAFDLVREYAPEDVLALALVLAAGIAVLLETLKFQKAGVSWTPILAVVAVTVCFYARYVATIMPPQAGDRTLALITGATVLFACISLAAGVFRKRTIDPLIVLTFALLALHLYYLTHVTRPDRNGQIVSLSVIAVLSLAAMSLARQRHGYWPMLFLLACIPTADWARVTWDQRFFAPPLQDGVPWVESIIGPPDRTLQSLKAQLQGEACRGGRKNVADVKPGSAPWQGYYTGQFFLRDYSGPMKFSRQIRILDSTALREFATRPWEMVDATGLGPGNEGRLLQAPAVSISCKSYGTSDISYLVDLDRPAHVVENEIYWKGWSAQLRCIDNCTQPGNIELEPYELHGFRSWKLPAGRYEMSARFRTPHLALGIGVSLAGLICWILLCAGLWRRRAA